jgi:hypothetical protein
MALAYSLHLNAAIALNKILRNTQKTPSVWLKRLKNTAFCCSNSQPDTAIFRKFFGLLGDKREAQLNRKTYLSLAFTKMAAYNTTTSGTAT